MLIIKVGKLITISRKNQQLNNLSLKKRILLKKSPCNIHCPQCSVCLGEAVEKLLFFNLAFSYVVWIKVSLCELVYVWISSCRSDFF